jgi:GT2 family glycosyltransferase
VLLLNSDSEVRPGALGVLDEGYFMYTEEVDLCYRLAQVGWEMWWVPHAEVVHYEAQSTRQVAQRMYLELYRSKVQFYRKHGGERRVSRYKRLLRLAYWPRIAIATLGARLSEPLGRQARTWRRLMAELPVM